MTLALTILMWILVGIMVLPMAVVVVECFAALLPKRSGSSSLVGEQEEGTATDLHPRLRVPCVVLMPAHDESAVIGATLAGLNEQLRQDDRVIVVADNCTDDTAMIARAKGAEVIERHDPVNRGKGYALAAGMDAIKGDPPAVVVFIDADCQLNPGSLDALVAHARLTGRPVQGVYLMRPPRRGDVKGIVSAFAFLVKNHARATGLSRLGQPVLLTGSGMAFAYETICDVTLATGDIVEDLNLGLDLSIRGHHPALCEDARIIGTLPGGDDAAITQRSRWEHGYLSTLLTRVPRLLGLAITRGRPRLISLALELCVPPLSLLMMLVILAWVAVLVGAAVTGIWWPLAVLTFAVVALKAALLAAWWRFAGDDLPLGAMLSIPGYMLWKMPVYLRFVKSREKDWVRTDREATTPHGR